MKKITTLVLTMAMIFCLTPAKVALAAGSTISNIPVVISNNGVDTTLEQTATLVMDTATFDMQDVKGEFFIIMQDETNAFGNTKDPNMDSDYDIGIMYAPYVFAVAPGTLAIDTAYTGMLTVPIPEGYDGSTAKIYESYDMVGEWKYEKSAVASFTDNTVSVPVGMKYYETDTNEPDGNGGYIQVGGFCCHVYIEFKKKVNISTLSGNAKIKDKTSYEYTGSAITPTVEITNLTENTHFTVSYTNNVNVGTAKATATGKGLYTGTLDIPFTITPMPIDKKKADAKLDKEEFDYTGKAIKPEVTITGLTEGTDFTVAYDKNIDPGTATVTITGKGNYKDSLTLEFKITKPAETSLTDKKTGAAYVVKTDGDTSEATYNAAKSKDEKTVTIPDTVTLPNGEKAKVTAVAKNACKGNKKLTKATIGNNVKSVGNNAFNGCAKLKTLKFGKRVEKIGDGAARNCKALKKVTIPASTKTIGKNAFNGDSNLKEITVNCKNLKSVGKNAIKNINSNATIKLKGSAKQKKAAEKLITNKKTGYKKTMKIKK